MLARGAAIAAPCSLVIGLLAGLALGRPTLLCRRGARLGETGARPALIANALIFAVLTLVTLVGGLSDVLT